MSSTFSSWESNVPVDNGNLTPFQKFMYALRAPESKRQYPRRLQVFLDFLKLPGLTVEEKVSLFYGIIEQKGKIWRGGVSEVLSKPISIDKIGSRVISLCTENV